MVKNTTISRSYNRSHHFACALSFVRALAKSCASKYGILDKAFPALGGDMSALSGRAVKYATSFVAALCL